MFQGEYFCRFGVITQGIIVVFRNLLSHRGGVYTFNSHPRVEMYKPQTEIMSET